MSMRRPICGTVARAHLLFWLRTAVRGRRVRPRSYAPNAFLIMFWPATGHHLEVRNGFWPSRCSRDQLDC